MARNKLRARREDVTNNRSREERTWRNFEKDLASPKRARNSKGQLKADDPSTPNVNEAYVGGKGPAKKKPGRPKKK